MSDVTTTVTVQFTGNNEDAQFPDPNLLVELDSGKHLEIYAEENKSTFYTGQRCYFRVFFLGSYSMHFASSMGTTRKEYGTGVKTITEIVKFENSSTAELSNIPEVTPALTYTWLSAGESLTPLFTGKTVSLNKKALGVLSCTYGVKYYKASLLVSTSEIGTQQMVPVIFHTYLTTQGGAGSIIDDDGDSVEVMSQAFNEVTYFKGISDVVTIIRVLDYKTDQPLQNASVLITKDGGEQETLTTDINGEASYTVTPGVRYSVETTMADYISTKDDILDNDFFVLPLA